MRYLGIDYGSKRVGLATSDEDGVFAFPYKVLKNDMALVDTVHNICGEEDISAIVIGESTDASGSPNKIMGSIEEFKKNLEVELDMPVYLQKEFMTSLHAGNQKTKDIFSDRQMKKEREVKDDSKSAALILQRYLDKNNQK